MLQFPCNHETNFIERRFQMRKEIEININKRKLAKKLEKVVLKKYPPNNQYNDAYDDTDPQCVRLGGTIFTPVNGNMPFGLPRETLSYNHRRIRCSHCEIIITVPFGYNHCPNCGETVYVDKTTASLK